MLSNNHQGLVLFQLNIVIGQVSFCDIFLGLGILVRFFNFLFVICCFLCFFHNSFLNCILYFLVYLDLHNFITFSAFLLFTILIVMVVHLLHHPVKVLLSFRLFSFLIGGSFLDFDFFWNLIFALTLFLFFPFQLDFFQYFPLSFGHIRHIPIGVLILRLFIAVFRFFQDFLDRSFSGFNFLFDIFNLFGKTLRCFREGKYNERNVLFFIMNARSHLFTGKLLGLVWFLHWWCLPFLLPFPFLLNSSFSLFLNSCIPFYSCFFFFSCFFRLLLATIDFSFFFLLLCSSICCSFIFLNWFPILNLSLLILPP